MRAFLVFALFAFVLAQNIAAQHSKSTFVVKEKINDSHSGATMQVLQPILPVKLGVEVEQGPPVGPSDVLTCEAKLRTSKEKTTDGKAHMMRYIVLVCDKRTLVVKSLQFTPN